MVKSRLSNISFVVGMYPERRLQAKVEMKLTDLDE